MKLTLIFALVLLAGTFAPAMAEDVQPVNVSSIDPACFEKDYLSGGPMLQSWTIFDRWNWPEES